MKKNKDIYNLIQLTDNANSQLIAMEREALKYVSLNKMNKAQEILNSASYIANKKEYIKGINKTIEWINTQSELINQERINSYKKIIFISILIILIVTAITIYIGRFLHKLNETLEKRVKEEVRKSHQKDLTLLEQSRLASMGEMISNIAHQWRQPLSAISSTASGLKVIYASDIHISKQEQIDNMESIIKQSDYLSNTINTFRDFLKTDKKLQVLDIKDEIHQSINIVKASLEKKFIHLKYNLNEQENMTTKMPKGELAQALINIINNAKDILLEKSVEHGWVEIYTETTEDKVVISIEDNGGGIPEEILPKIYDPYFTTKHQSKGIGLGLHMTYKIITESLNGKLHVQNTKNGAKFFIEIPMEIQQ